MLYPGDTYVFVLPILRSDGADPVITGTPTLQLLNARTGAAVFGSAQNMTLVVGTRKVYTYTWSIPQGLSAPEDYVAVVTYVADAVTYAGRFLEQLRIGDSRVTGPVALDGTVAKEATVAKDATVAKASDLAAIDPDNSNVVLAIKERTDRIPDSPANEATLNSLLTLLTDVHDAELGKVIIDKSASPTTMTVYRPDNSVLVRWQLIEEDTKTTKLPE